MRGIITYFALGLLSLIESIQKANDIPVATGIKKQLFMYDKPLINEKFN